MSVRTTLGIIILTIMLPLEAAERTYAADWSNANWKVEGSRMMCRLQHPLPNYGVAEFFQKHAQTVEFVLHRDASLMQKGFATIEGVTPSWKSNGKAALLGKASLHTGLDVLTTDTPLAVRMLSALDQGQLTRISYQGDANEHVKVDVTPLNFQTAYAQFVQCQGQLLAFNKESVKNTEVFFENNNNDLTEAALVQLNRIAEYVAADKEIRRVFIAGYSDGSGRTGYNNWLSELRAKAVRDYLKLKGVPEKKIKITWYGKKQSLTDSTSEVGRALNRRVNVKLYGF